MSILIYSHLKNLQLFDEKLFEITTDINKNKDI